MYTSSHGFSFLVLFFDGVLHISVATLCRKIRDWGARWDDWFEKSIILILNGYFWFIALRRFILPWKQLFDFICRASTVVCNALKEVGYILDVLWNGNKVCCGCEKCTVWSCISCLGTVWHCLMCVVYRNLFLSILKRKSRIWREFVKGIHVMTIIQDSL